jgi:hypothetical protein
LIRQLTQCQLPNQTDGISEEMKCTKQDYHFQSKLSIFPPELFAGCSLTCIKSKSWSAHDLLHEDESTIMLWKRSLAQPLNLIVELSMFWSIPPVGTHTLYAFLRLPTATVLFLSPLYYCIVAIAWLMWYCNGLLQLLLKCIDSHFLNFNWSQSWYVANGIWRDN